MQRQVRVLHLEDNPADAELIQTRFLQEIPAAEIRWVTSGSAFEEAIAQPFDLILCDFHVRDYDALEAIRTKLRVQPDTPLVVVTGTLTEEEAIECVAAGATDFVLKDGLHRLAPAVVRALREADEQRQRRSAEEALRVTQERLQLALDAANISVWDFDVKSGHVALSGQLVARLGYGAHAVPARRADWEKLVHREDVAKLRRALLRHHRGESPAVSVEYRVRAKDGSWHWLQTVGRAVARDDAGRALRMSGTHRDITEVKQYQEELAYHAYYDALTGLANKTLLQDRIRQAIALAARKRSKCALLYLDLDRFKVINDSLGYTCGDELLKAIAARLSATVRDSDTIARLGADEFGLLLCDFDAAASLPAIARKILDEVSQPVQLGEHEVFSSASIGVAVFPEDGQDAATLLRNADSAMYRAKQQGRNQASFYTDDFNRGAAARLRLETDLRRAIAQKEFELHYQPRVHLRTGRVTSVEALIRWRHPERGMVPPLEFVPMAEETGLIVPMGLLVLRMACEQMRQWRDAGLNEMRVAVNLSARQFRDADLAGQIGHILRETGLESAHLELEITESSAMHDPELTQRILQELRELGFTHAIDDFGTGYSSLAYLKRFPIDYLKIDRSFVDGLPDDEHDSNIVGAIIALGKSLNLTLIAEGVETERQRDFLRLRGCDEMQGYIFCRPLPAHELTDVLASACV